MLKRLDDWFWRSNPSSFSLDHVRRPPFLEAGSRRMLNFRGAMAAVYIILMVVHLKVSGTEFWLFCTNWNLILTTLTFIFLFIESWKHQNTNDTYAPSPACESAIGPKTDLEMVCTAYQSD